MQKDVQKGSLEEQAESLANAMRYSSEEEIMQFLKNVEQSNRELAVAIFAIVLKQRAKQ